MEMKIMFAIIFVAFLVAVLYPYYSIWDIHKSIDRLTEEVRKLRKGEKDG